MNHQTTGNAMGKTHHNGYDIIVVGGGHAAIEAALASARMGAKTLMLTINIDSIGAMSCNPAIGGIAKGNLVKDLDALGGEMPKAADDTGIQFKTLNRKKGPAVRGTRTQSDKHLYNKRMVHTIASQQGLFVKQAIVTDIITTNNTEITLNSAPNKVVGVTTDIAGNFYAPRIIITAGTFLNGKVHIGQTNYSAGRMNEFASIDLPKSMAKLGLTTLRLKTGTPARLDITTIDFNQLQEHPGDNNTNPFSFDNTNHKMQQISCYATYTNNNTHNIIKANMHLSPLFSGQITGVGARYCPSVEDKVKKFPSREQHIIMLEPEGLNSREIYANGMSSSLPTHVQLQAYRTCKGMENVELIRSAYAIEYDAINPQQLDITLQTKTVHGLYFAGQLNGTSGYEEAATQGFIAGVNAVLSLDNNNEPFILSRHESYIGVMIDDLVTKGIDEPYRMFTSRAEFRLHLREDNAEYRLLEKGYKLGLITKTRLERFKLEQSEMTKEVKRLEKTTIYPDKNHEHTTILNKIGANISEHTKAAELLKRPEISYKQIVELIGEATPNTLLHHKHHQRAMAQAEITIKYSGYIKRQWEEILAAEPYDKINIPNNMDYRNIQGLRNEFIEKLEKVRPATLGQASRIQGVTPSALSLLHMHLKIKGRSKT